MRRHRRRIIDAFIRAGATAPASAASLDALGVEKSWLFEIQRLRGVLVPVDEERFYLDEVREAAVSRFRRAVAGTILALAVVVVFSIWYLGRL